MASVDFTPIGKKRPNTKFQVIRGYNAEENRPNNRNLFHTLKDSTNIHHDVGDFSFDETTREWEDDFKKQAVSTKPHKRSPRHETVFANVGLGVNQSEEIIHRLESEALSWKIKYKELLKLVEEMEVDSNMIEVNAELKSQLKLMEERLQRTEKDPQKDPQKEKYLLELEHKDKMIHRLIRDMEKLEKELQSHDKDDSEELKHECLQLRQKLSIYEEKLSDYDMVREGNSEIRKQSQEDSRQIKELKRIIEENDQIHRSELDHLKLLLANAELKLNTAQKEVNTMKEKSSDTSQARRHFQADLNELSDVNQGLRKQLDSQSQKSKQLQADVDALTRTKSDLLRQIEHERNKSNDLASDVRQYDKDNRLLVDKLDKEKERVKDLVSEVQIAQRAIERGRHEQAEMERLLGKTNNHLENVDAERVSSLKKEQSQLQNKMKEVVSHCQDLEEEVTSLKTKLKNKANSNLEQEAQIHTLEEENLHLALDHEKLASTNQSLKNEIEKMKADLQICLHEIDQLENLNEMESEKRVSQLLSSEHALKEEVSSLSKLVLSLEEELRLLKEEGQDNKELFDDNRELVRKLKEMQRILEDLGVSSKEELDIFETNVRDRIMTMKNELKDSDLLVRKLENELKKTHEEIRFLQDRVVSKEEQLKSVESLLNGDKKEEESAIQAYQEFQLKKAREELSGITEQLKNTKLDRDAEIARVEKSNNDKVKELQDQISDYKSQLSNSTKDYRKLTEKMLEYKTNLKSVEDIERVKFYINGWQYFKQRYRDAALKASDYMFMYDYAINQIKNSRFKVSDDSKLAVVGLYPEYVGGSTKPKRTFKGLALSVIASIRLSKRTKYEKTRFKELNKTRKELDDARTRFKNKEKPYVVKTM